MPHDSKASERDRALISAQHLGPSRAIAEREGLSEPQVEETLELLRALHAWQLTAEDHSAAAEASMHVGTTDMRAIRYVLACQRDGEIVTSGKLAEHLGIAGPSVTKLINRLEQHGHVRRAPHPFDRRATSIVVTEETTARARRTIGADHARRFGVVAQLTSEERQVATKVLRELAALPVGEFPPDG